jgi:hypothetical protein
MTLLIWLVAMFLPRSRETFYTLITRSGRFDTLFSSIKLPGTILASFFILFESSRVSRKGAKDAKEGKNGKGTRRRFTQETSYSIPAFSLRPLRLCEILADHTAGSTQA